MEETINSIFSRCFFKSNNVAHVDLSDLLRRYQCNGDHLRELRVGIKESLQHIIKEVNPVDSDERKVEKLLTYLNNLRQDSTLDNNWEFRNAYYIIRNLYAHSWSLELVKHFEVVFKILNFEFDCFLSFISNKTQNNLTNHDYKEVFVTRFTPQYFNKNIDKNLYAYFITNSLEKWGDGSIKVFNYQLPINNHKMRKLGNQKAFMFFQIFEEGIFQDNDCKEDFELAQKYIRPYAQKAIMKEPIATINNPNIISSKQPKWFNFAASNDNIYIQPDKKYKNKEFYAIKEQILQARDFAITNVISDELYTEQHFDNFHFVKILYYGYLSKNSDNHLVEERYIDMLIEQRKLDETLRDRHLNYNHTYFVFRPVIGDSWDNLLSEVFDFQPNIIHFTGVTSKNDGAAHIQNDEGKVDIPELFSSFHNDSIIDDQKNSIELLIFDACSNDKISKAYQTISNLDKASRIISSNKALNNKSKSREFFQFFYRELFKSSQNLPLQDSISFAFNQGKKYLKQNYEINDQNTQFISVQDNKEDKVYQGMNNFKLKDQICQKLYENPTKEFQFNNFVKLLFFENSESEQDKFKAICHDLYSEDIVDKREISKYLKTLGIKISKEGYKKLKPFNGSYRSFFEQDSSLSENSIQNAVDNLRSANYAGYFEEIDKIIPFSLMSVYNEHKGKFIAGKTPWNFSQQLEVFTLVVKESLKDDKGNNHTNITNTNTTSSNKETNILLVASNPAKTKELKLLNDELSYIQEHCKSFDTDILRQPNSSELLDKFPSNPKNSKHYNIVHFTGHGNQAGVYLYNLQKTSPELLGVGLLKGLFVELPDNRKPDVILLNSCYSDDLIVEDILNLIPHIIATKSDIPENIALSFTTRFYKVLSTGNSIRDSFNEARRNAIMQGASEELFVFYENGHLIELKK